MTFVEFLTEKQMKEINFMNKELSYIKFETNLV